MWCTLVATQGGKQVAFLTQAECHFVHRNRNMSTRTCASARRFVDLLICMWCKSWKKSWEQGRYPTAAWNKDSWGNSGRLWQWLVITISPHFSFVCQKNWFVLVRKKKAIRESDNKIVKLHINLKHWWKRWTSWKMDSFRNQWVLVVIGASLTCTNTAWWGSKWKIWLDNASLGS